MVSGAGTPPLFTVKLLVRGLMDLRFARGLHVRSIVASVGEQAGWIMGELMLVTLGSRTMSVGGVSSPGSSAEKGQVTSVRYRRTLQRHSENIPPLC